MRRVKSRAGRGLLRALGLAAFVVLGVVPAALAAPQVKIREAFPGTSATGMLPPTPGTGYVELQAYAPGQTTLTPAHLTVWNSTGAQTFDVTLNNVPNGVDQATVLVGGTLVTSPPPDQSVALFSLDRAGGAVCVGGAPVDCVAWGPQSIVYAPALPGAVGTHVDTGGIPFTSALRRTIVPNCPSLLEAADDTDNSATDFNTTTLNPRNNATPPTEGPCTSGTLPALPNPTSSTPQQTAKKKKKCKKRHKAKKTAAAAKKKCKKKKK